MPWMRYSIGSSIVMMLFLPSCKCNSPAYNVEVFPDPVGPVTRMTFDVPLNTRNRRFSTSAGTPSDENELNVRSDERIRATTFSPCTVGRTETRKSFAPSAVLMRRRPSWGLRRSAMSIPQSNLIRVSTAACACCGMSKRCWMMPSTRTRTATLSLSGVRCMSLAAHCTASEKILFTRRTIGAEVASP